jgi:predicted DNA-binding protein (MmcQ/YjbR family)
MSIETDVFANYLIVPARLVEYGFVQKGKKLVYAVDMSRGNFQVVIEYAHDKISGTIIDKSIDAEYTNFRIENDIGYAADVRERYINILTDIRDKCAINQHFASAAARNAAAFIYHKFVVSPEFLWEKYPSFAVFRRTDNQKWFALVANIPLCKLKPCAKRTEMVDIINIKIDTNQTDNILKKRGFYPAYHMNKKSWATIILDGTVTDKTIEEFICDSFSRA